LLQVELHGIANGDQLLLWREAGDGQDVLRMAVRPQGEAIEEVTESDDDVPLSRPEKRPRTAEVQAHTPDTNPSAGAASVESSWDGYVRPKCGDT
jgi:hypothetical protein